MITAGSIHNKLTEKRLEKAKIIRRRDQSVSFSLLSCLSLSFSLSLSLSLKHPRRSISPPQRRLSPLKAQAQAREFSLLIFLGSTNAFPAPAPADGTTPEFDAAAAKALSLDFATSAEVMVEFLYRSESLPGLKFPVGFGSGTESTFPVSAETGSAAAESEREAFLAALLLLALAPPVEIVVALSLPLGALAVEAASAAALASATAASAGASEGEAAGMASL